MRQYVTNWDKVPILVDVGFIAMLFGVSREKARQLCAAGTVPAFKVDGMWRVSKRALMQFCGEMKGGE